MSAARARPVKALKKIAGIEKSDHVLAEYESSYYLCIVLKTKSYMKEFEELTPDEEELIAAIRNYNKSYPNGKRELMRYINQLLDGLIRQD